MSQGFIKGACDAPFSQMLWIDFKPEVTMRIDKYLKNARLIKRRTVAKEACDQGRITVNSKVAKPGTEVFVGDEVVISFGNRKITLKITALEEHVKKEEAKELYEILSEEKIEAV